MQGSDIIKLILSDLGIKAPTFAKSIGLQYQRILDIQNNKTKKISTTVADCIIEKYPQYSRAWLLTGEGEMLAQSSSSPSLEATSVALSSEAILSKTIEMLAESNRVLAETNRRLVEKLSNLQGDTAK